MFIVLQYMSLFISYGNAKFQFGQMKMFVFFLALKIIALTREVSALQRKVNNAANSTEPIDIRGECCFALYPLEKSVQFSTVSSLYL